MWMRSRLFLAILLFAVLVSASACAPVVGASSQIDDRLDSIVQPYTFNFGLWEYHTLSGQVKEDILDFWPLKRKNEDSDAALRYFSYAGQINSLSFSLREISAGKLDGDSAAYERKLADLKAQKAALQSQVERTLARQITETLISQGIYNPFINRFKMTFPPVNFKLEKPLSVLVVSPREKIQQIKSVTVKQGISPAEIEELEGAVDGLSVSSLVVEIGGLGVTYPTFVVDNADLRWTIETAAHEWLHQYLAFRPLGFGYVLNLLGVTVNTSIPTINETVANIAGQELGRLVYDRYYGGDQPDKDIELSPPARPVFDFNKEMREIRLAVDSYLSRGDADEAEALMNEKQKYLAVNGYYIRKLNQAYFAFYGSYADSPTSVDPIGEKLKAVRAHSLNVKDFLDTVSAMRNPRDLDKVISEY